MDGHKITIRNSTEAFDCKQNHRIEIERVKKRKLNLKSRHKILYDENMAG